MFGTFETKKVGGGSWRAMLLAGVASGAICGVANAGADRHGWYVGLELGAVWVEETPFRPVANNVDFETGTAALGTAGYAFEGNWRVEGEIGWRSGNDTDTFNGVPVSGGGLEAFSGMVNLIWDEPITDRLLIDLGAGAGFNVASFTFPSGLEDSDTVFAAQGIFGLTYRLSDHWDINATYRGIWGEDSQFINVATVATMDPFTHVVALGFRYGYDEPEAAPVAPPPPPPPPPAAKQFIVFFGFNKSNMTAEGQAVVVEAAAAAKAQGSARIVIVGHTDSVGSNAYNDQLSQRRAGAVKDELSRLGISSDAITASGKGETELMVQTGDGVKEPQNRRATINLN